LQIILHATSPGRICASAQPHVFCQIDPSPRTGSTNCPPPAPHPRPRRPRHPHPPRAHRTGWSLHFTGRHATSDTRDGAFDEIERLFSPPEEREPSKHLPPAHRRR
jgi:hypothetical protein